MITGKTITLKTYRVIGEIQQTFNVELTCSGKKTMARCEKYGECANSIPNGCGTLGVWEQCFIPLETPTTVRSGLVGCSISDCENCKSWKQYFNETQRLSKEKLWYRKALYLACGGSRKKVQMFLEQAE